MDWKVEYYKKVNGTIPIIDFLLSIDVKMRAKAFSEMEPLASKIEKPYRISGQFNIKIVKVCDCYLLH